MVADALDTPGAPKKDLCGADAMLPFLTKVLAVDHAVDGVVAKIRMNLLYAPVEFGGTHRSVSHHMENRVRENCVRGPARRTGSEDFRVRRCHATVEFDP